MLLESQDPLVSPSAIRYVELSHRSANALQSRILEVYLADEGVRDFTTRELVWKA